MKKLFYLFVIGELLMTSCNGNLTSNNKSENTIQTRDSIVKEDKTNKIDTKNFQIDKDNLDISFVGKTTQELNKYNLDECFGGIIDDKLESTKYAVAKYSLNRENCWTGKSKITLEKFNNYYNEGKANFVIKDELLVSSKFPEKCYSTIVIELNNEPESDYLIEFEDNSEEVLTKIHKIWKIDLSKLKFIKIEKPKNFTCYNPNYADGI